jgi:hypothetical protein
MEPSTRNSFELSQRMFADGCFGLIDGPAVE